MRRIGLSLALCVLLLTAGAPPCPAQPLALDDQTAWTALIQHYRSKRALASQSMDQITEELTGLTPRMRTQIRHWERTKGRVLLWLGTSTDPKDFRDCHSGLVDIRREVAGALQDPEYTRLEITALGDRLADICQEITFQLDQNPEGEHAGDLRTFLEVMGHLRNRVDGLRDSLDQVLAPAQVFLGSLDDSLRGLEQKAREAWAAYYLHQDRRLFSAQAWTTVREETSRMQDLFILFAELSGEMSRGWRVPLAEGVILAFLLWLAGEALLRRTAAGLDPPVRRRLRQGLLALALAALFLHQGVHGLVMLSEPAIGLSLTLFSGGLLLVSRALRAALGEQDHGTPILAVVWGLQTLGLALDALSVPYAPLGVLWILALLASLALLWRPASRGKSTLGRMASRLCLGFLPVLAVLSLFGRMRLSILLVGGLFVLLLCLRTAPALSDFINRWKASALKEGESVFWSGLASGVGFPVALLGFLFLNLWFLAYTLGGESLFFGYLTLETRWENVSLSLQKIGLIVLGFYLTRAALFASRAMLHEYPARRPGISRGVVESLALITGYLWWVGYVLFVLFVLGFNLTSLAVVAGGLSVGVGMGLQSMVSNFLSGLILLFGRFIEPGDTIQIGDTVGTVRKVSTRHTLVHTRDNAALFVPNSELLSNRLINWSHRDKSVRRTVEVGVAYDSDLALVTELMLAAAREASGTQPQPPARVLLDDFGPSALVVKLQFWIRDVTQEDPVLSEVRRAVERLFRQHGVVIAYPQTDVHLHGAADGPAADPAPAAAATAQTPARPRPRPRRPRPAPRTERNTPPTHS